MVEEAWEREVTGQLNTGRQKGRDKMIQHIAQFLIVGASLSGCIMWSSEAMRHHRTDPKSWGLTCMFLGIGSGALFAYTLMLLIEKAVK